MTRKFHARRDDREQAANARRAQRQSAGVSSDERSFHRVTGTREHGHAEGGGCERSPRTGPGLAHPAWDRRDQRFGGAEPVRSAGSSVPALRAFRQAQAATEQPATSPSRAPVPIKALVTAEAKSRRMGVSPGLVPGRGSNRTRRRGLLARSVGKPPDQRCKTGLGPVTDGHAVADEEGVEVEVKQPAHAPTEARRVVHDSFG